MSARLRHATRDTVLAVAARRAVRPMARRATPERLLIIQPDHLGDVLLSQPAVTLLGDALPDVKLVGVVGPWSATIARRAWPVDDVVEVAFPGFTRLPVTRMAQLRGEAYREVHAVGSRLRALDADLAVVLRPDAWWAAWAAALAAPDVVTGDDPLTARFGTRAAALTAATHAAERSAAIAIGALRKLGTDALMPTWHSHLLRLPVDAEARDRVRARLGMRDNRQLAVVHPGAGAEVKQWLTHRWPAVIDHLRARGMQVVLTGGSSERDLCAEIAALDPDVTDLSGTTSLEELIELLRMARVVVGPDSGPLHLAVATGTPSVHLFGPADFRRYGPWGDPQRHHVVDAGVTCPQCGDLSPTRAAGCGCMLAITTTAVQQAIDAVLAHAEMRALDEPR